MNLTISGLTKNISRLPQDDRAPRGDHRLHSGQETSGQKPPEAAEGQTEDETIQRGRIRRESISPARQAGPVTREPRHAPRDTRTSA